MPKKCHYCKRKLPFNIEKVEDPVTKNKMYICEWCLEDKNDEIGKSLSQKFIDLL